MKTASSRRRPVTTNSLGFLLYPSRAFLGLFRGLVDHHFGTLLYSLTGLFGGMSDGLPRFLGALCHVVPCLLHLLSDTLSQERRRYGQEKTEGSLQNC